MAGHGLERLHATGCDDADAVGIDTLDRLVPVWSLDTGSEVTGAPAITHDAVYFGDWAGVVHAVGEGVTSVKVGDRVAVYHFRSCGHCEECRSGRMMWCDERQGYGGPIHGSDDDLLLTDDRNCLTLPGDASFALGAMLMCVGGTAYEAMTKLDARSNKRIAIFGMGPVGLAGLLFAKAMGAEVVGIDVAPHRLELAAALGADSVINSRDEDVTEAVKRWSGKDGVSGSFETSGVASAQSATVAVTGNGGRVAFVGFGSSTPSITPAEFIGKQLDAYVLFNTKVAYTFTRNIEGALGVNNIFDRRYASYGVRGANAAFEYLGSTARYNLYPAPGRNFYAALTVRY